MDKTAKFIEKIKLEFPQSWQKTLDEMDRAPLLCFRLNTLKKLPDVIGGLVAKGFELRKLQVPDTFAVTKTPRGVTLSRCEYAERSEIYIQNVSSLFACLALEAKPNENILDLCAAPGGKTSYIAQLSQNKANLVAVENNKDRYFRLKANLEALGVDNAIVLRANALTLVYKYPAYANFFDKILVDAPCTNESHYRPLKSADLGKWNPKNIDKLSRLQKKLISTAFDMLKPNGTLVYSTCSFCKEENEDVIDYLLKKNDSAELLNVAVPGFSTQNTIGVRLPPSDIFDPFYFAKIRYRPRF